MSEVLDAVDGAIDGVLARHGLPVVVLDIDSTLFSTAERHRRILVDFALAQGDDALIAFATATSAADFGWSVDDPLVAAGLDEPARCASLMRFWGPRFFSSDYAKLDTPTPGAVAYVQSLVARGAFVVYLTARTTPQMSAGTVALLQGNHLPLFDGRTALVMKPGSGTSDGDFKAEVLPRLARLGTVVATFDNEPHHVNTFRSAFPDGVHVWLNTVHGPDAPRLEDGAHTIGDFRREP